MEASGMKTAELNGMTEIHERATEGTRSPGRLSRWLIAAGCCVALLGLGVLAVGWMGAERAIHQPQRRGLKTLADFPELARHAEHVVFPTKTGVRLAGTLFHGGDGATVIVSHGNAGDQRQMLAFAEFLNAAGFSVLTYDMRDRGESQALSPGAATTFGALEHKDLISAVDYLVARQDAGSAKIGALGTSLGGSTTLLAAAEDPRIAAVVDDSGFSSVQDAVATNFERVVHLPAFPFAPLTIGIASLRTGIDVEKIRPVDVVASISPRPVLMIHCDEDRVIPIEHSQRLFAAAHQPKQLWTIPGGSHALGHIVATEEYERRVIEFFRNALLH